GTKMPTLAELNNATNVVALSTPIVEPILGPASTEGLMRRFGDHYDTSVNSHLYRFIIAVCGEAGGNALKKELLIPRLQQLLSSTYFTNLDQMYGAGLGLPRLSYEIYHLDPGNDMLTSGQWQEVKAKDAAYRERCLTWMKALLEGPTPRGLALAAEAAIGVEADIFEQYQYIDNQASDNPFSMTNLGQTNSRREFVVMPRAPDLTEKEKRDITRQVDRLRPVNTVSTIFSGDYLRNEQPVNRIASTSDAFYVQKFVTGNPSVDWPAVDLSNGFWIGTQETEAPTFAFMDRQESVTYLSVYNVTASSEMIGLFNKTQQGLFENLSGTDPFFD